MNKFIKNSLTAILGIVAVGMISSSCKKSFENPPIHGSYPSITANTTIRELKALHKVAGGVEHITDDKIIRGIVVADDQSGNLYKSIIIQDATGGILLRLGDYNLYNVYSVGTEVFVKCKDLWLGDYNKLIQLGGDTSTSASGFLGVGYIPTALFSKHLVTGTHRNPVIPRVVKTKQLTTDMHDTLQNTLIQLDGFEFASADLGKTYADPTLASTAVEFTVKNCLGQSALIRTSSYARFSVNNVAPGNGSFVSVFQLFGTTKQFIIRDTNDVKFYNARCGSNPTTYDLATIKSLYDGSDVVLPLGTKIKGTVISDVTKGNISTKEVVIQDGNTGIDLFFSAAVAYNPGDSLLIDVGGLTLTQFNGFIEVKTVPPANVSVVGTGKTVVPKQMTIAQLIAGLTTGSSLSSSIDYTLVTLTNTTASGGTTYGSASANTSRTLTDASGNMVLWTLKTANFATSALPSTPKSWTGYAYNFKGITPEFMIRSASDVQ